MLDDRFWSKVDKSSPNRCWEWTAQRNNKGYGQMRHGPAHKKALAHRLSYEYHHGPIPRGLYILHSCDNPACVNPSHLRAGSQEENQREMALKNRWKNAGHKGAEIGTSKLTEDQVVAIREAYLDDRPINDIASAFSVSRPTVKRIIRGATWAHLFGVKGPSLHQLQKAKRPSGWVPPLR